jgi:lysozyme family protein
MPPTTIKLTALLREEYQHLFDTCQIRPDKAGEVEAIVAKIEGNRNRYESVGNPLKIPWYLIAVIHNMEASLAFNTHLHNGDPLSARTVQEPPGRPREGNPPFTWEESATDALKYDRIDQWQDWTLPAMLFKLEGYNGWGYRLYHPQVLSPYLWSGSNHYRSGKYVKDGRWSDTAVSAQIGAAVLLRRLAEKGMADFSQPVIVDTTSTPLLRYAPAEKSPYAMQLQVFLNQLPGIFVKEDGFAGSKTSEAFQKVSGHYLHGDPRGQA